MDKLRKKYYPNASLNDIRKSKTRRKKHRRELDGEEYELAQLPHAAVGPKLNCHSGGIIQQRRGAGLELIVVWH